MDSQTAQYKIVPKKNLGDNLTWYIAWLKVFISTILVFFEFLQKGVKAFTTEFA